jgi:hypothetical protein
MLNEENLLAAGYKKFNDPSKQVGHTAYQKRVLVEKADNEWRTEYFINVYHYQFDLPGYSHESWQLDMAFERHSKLAPYAWVQYSLEADTPVDKLDLIAASLFYGNNGAPYGD